MTRILILNGSYRAGGAIDQAVDLAAQTALAAQAEIEVVHLRDVPIEFCINCRHCTQTPGESPGTCVHEDRMRELIEKIEAADSFVLASPTNFSSVTAVFKRFMERLLVYAYWPWGMPSPKRRIQTVRKRAVVLTSSAAPGLIARFFFSTLRQLKLVAKLIGAKPLGSLSIGMVSNEEKPTLSPPTRKRVEHLVMKLV